MCAPSFRPGLIRPEFYQAQVHVCPTEMEFFSSVSNSISYRYGKVSLMVTPDYIAILLRKLYTFLLCQRKKKCLHN